MARDHSSRPTVDAHFTVIGRLIDGTGKASSAPGAIVVRDGVIAARATGPSAPKHANGPSELRLRAAYVTPGFVDLQVNGAFGHEVGPDPEALNALAQALPATGVTAFLPTLVSRSTADYAACFAAFDQEQEAQLRGLRGGAARLLGLHLEGPLLSSARAGAHPRAAIEAATAALLDGLCDPRRVRLVTLAPEREGALPLIRSLRARGIVVGLGHTDASFEAFIAAVDAGATLATHVWNAMPPFHHRSPGAVGAALADDRVMALLIADGVHTHAAAFKVAARAKGAGRLALVSDAIAGAGRPPGPSQLAGRAVVVDATSARLPDGTLAGSTLTMDRAVRNAMRFAALSIEEAVAMAVRAPRAALEAGDLAANPAPRPRTDYFAAGSPADLVLLDDDFTVRATFVAGHLAYAKDDDLAALRA